MEHYTEIKTAYNEIDSITLWRPNDKGYMMLEVEDAESSLIVKINREDAAKIIRCLSDYFSLP